MHIRTTHPLAKHLAIKVDSLTKIYPLYASPNDRLKEALHPRRKKFHKEFYALRNVSFEVEKGDSLGIIGQNGSGKSTLLKIISRVLTPSTGSFQISGRVISLLELGSGFNPELTGLENIYFYGTILGFSKKKIESKLDEIISFADIGQFINQSLKTYSSGMRARLAFSVASNVDPDILILDEVLAVGDLRFKQKCLRVMRDIIDQKRTVILVTHDTGAVTNFCNKTMWLEKGNVEDFGLSENIVKKYVGFMTYGLETVTKKEITEKSNKETPNKTYDIEESKEKDQVSIKDIKWTDVSQLESFGQYGAVIQKVALYFKDTNRRVETLKGGEWLSLYASVKIDKSIESPGFGIKFKDRRGNGVFTVNNYLYDKPLRKFDSGENPIIITNFKIPLLMSGKYMVTVALSDGDQISHIQHHWIHDALVVTIENPAPIFKRGGNILVIEPNYYGIQLLES